MPTKIRITLTALATTLLLATATTTATAGRLSIDDRDFYVFWNDSSQRISFNAGGSAIACEVTLLGSFHSNTIRKVTRLLGGTIEHVDVDEAGCSNGTVDINGTLPWHVSYEGFTGTLPAISVVRALLTGLDFLIFNTAASARCITDPVNQNIAGNVIVDTLTGVIDALDAEENPTLSVSDLPESALCDLVGSGRYNGNGSVLDEPIAGSPLVIRLI